MKIITYYNEKNHFYIAELSDRNEKINNSYIEEINKKMMYKISTSIMKYIKDYEVTFEYNLDQLKKISVIYISISYKNEGGWDNFFISNEKSKDLNDILSEIKFDTTCEYILYENIAIPFNFLETLEVLLNEYKKSKEINYNIERIKVFSKDQIPKKYIVIDRLCNFITAINFDTGILNLIFKVQGKEERKIINEHIEDFIEKLGGIK
ncbi:TPA: hypothetical protein ACOM7Y_002698 [Staphylococcus aureus]